MTDPRNPNTPAASGSDGEDLRDARLARALQHMPDAHLQPSPQLRHAVLRQALQAVAQPEPGAMVLNRWRGWWQSLGQRGPWRAALASVAIAGFITVLWYGQELPDATSERSPVLQRKAEADSANANDGAASRSAALGETTGAPAAPAAATAEVREATAAAPAPAPVPLAQSARVTPPVVSGAGASKGADGDARRAANTATAAAAPPPAQIQATGRGPSEQEEAAAVPAPVLAEAVGAAAPPRSRADAKAAMAPGSGVLARVTVNGVSQPVDPEQARQLLALLRGLHYTPQPQRTALAPGTAPVVVEVAGVERWTVEPEQVVYQQLGGGRAVYAVISPAQYAAVRRRVQATPSPP